MWRVASAVVFFFGSVRTPDVLAQEPAASPAPQASASPVPTAQGPCENAPLSSVTQRPGIGRASSTGGAVCVASPGEVVIGLGYRNQATVATSRQTLLTYPQPVFELGLRGGTEVIAAPSLSYARRSGTSAALAPASGLQDAGLGVQHLLFDGARIQEAVELFYTFPTGYPAGRSGFTSGYPSLLGSYTIAFSPNSPLGVSLQTAIIVATGGTPSNAIARFAGVGETLSASYAVTTLTSVLAQDQISAPSGPQGSTGNRTLLAIQQTVSPNVVLDVDFEANLLPAPGSSQHTTFEFGLSVRP